MGLLLDKFDLEYWFCYILVVCIYLFIVYFWDVNYLLDIGFGYGGIMVIIIEKEE